MDIDELVRQVDARLPDLPQAAASEAALAVARIVEALRPERVYLFGSGARGDATPDSDLDIFVVVAASDLAPYRLDQLAYAAVGSHLLPLDIIVATGEEFERRSRVSGTLSAAVLGEGRLLYAA